MRFRTKNVYIRLISEISPTIVKWTETAADEMEESVKCLQKKSVQKHIMFNLGWSKTAKLLNRDQDLNIILSHKTENTYFACSSMLKRHCFDRWEHCFQKNLPCIENNMTFSRLYKEIIGDDVTYMAKISWHLVERLSN